MVDIVSAAARSRMMSAVRSRNTAPEVAIRRGLHSRGFRYRLHVRALPGSPDIVLPKWRTVLFVHGCFWHGHTCHLFRLPATRREWWRDKIDGNIARDSLAVEALMSEGWKVIRIWECAIRGREARGVKETIDLVESFVRGDLAEMEIGGR